MAVLVVAFLAVGIVGAVRYGVTFWLYRGFPAPHAPPTVLVREPGGTHQIRVAPVTVDHIFLATASLGGWPDLVYVILPPGYASHPWVRYPTLYLLHGSPGESIDFIRIGDVVVTDEVLLAEGRISPMIIVMPSGARTFLGEEEWANGVRPGNAWETFVAHDLVHAIDARYRTIARGASRGIGGLSEGGYGALNIGLHHVGEFGVLESWSGYMVADRIPAIFGNEARLLRYNSPAILLPDVAKALRTSHVYVWLYCGSNDELLHQNERFAAQLAKLGISHQFLVIRGRAHSWALWRPMMARSLEIASSHLSGG